MDTLKGADPASVFAELIRAGLQALIDAESTEVLGADRYERTDTRTTYRNGTRSETAATTSGDVGIQIPKLRSGSFFPSLLERRRRIDQALYAVIMEAYGHGVSTRNVDDLVSALGVDSGITKSQVSRICGGLDTEIARCRDRTLTHTTFPYVFLDATQGADRGARGLERPGGGDRCVDRGHARGTRYRRSISTGAAHCSRNQPRSSVR